MEYKDINLLEALDAIPCSQVEYPDWINVGMALKYEGLSFDVWDRWSQTDQARYDSKVCESKWKSFKGALTPVTAGSIVNMAKNFGYVPRSQRLLDWDDEIGVDKFDKGWIEPEPVKEKKTVDEYKEISSYISAMFKDDEIVSIVTKSYQDADGKYKPGGKGSSKTAKEWLADLEKHKDDVRAVIGDYDPMCGAWIRINPMDGKGGKNENVRAFRYALIESDDMDLSIQNALIHDMQLPVVMLVFSGSKSLHAIVHVDAPGKDIYRQRVEKIYKVCDQYGLKVDKSNKNPSRLSRLPGVRRGPKWQHIIDQNFGFSTYQEWEEFIDEELDEFPDPDDLFAGDKLPLPDTLIDGVLRQGGKMSLTGPSKAGKSFLLMQLAIAIATGSDWLGHECKQKKVLYVNFEIDKASMQDRYWNICQALEMDHKELSGKLDNWNMKGHSAPITKLKDSMIRRCLKGGYGAVIIDPIYKTLTGDENSATDMSEFTSIFDEICNKTGVSIIYAHHHSKGSQSAKTAADRSSGSGVFARDPNAIVDMLQIKPEDGDGHAVEIPEGATAWRVECTLRDFATPEPFEIVFEYPRHLVWDGLDEAPEMYQATGHLSRREKQEKGHATMSRNRRRRDNDLVAFINEYTKNHHQPPTVEEASRILSADGGKGFSVSSIKNKLNPKHPSYIPGLKHKNWLLFYEEPMDFDDEV